MDKLKTKKGFMFTLVTVVLVVLMLGEILTYIYTNIQFASLTVASTPSFAATSLYSSIRAQSPSFLQKSLKSAAFALSAYEASNIVGHGINSSQYALTSLMKNGTIYGTNMISYMGNYTLNSYYSTLSTQAIRSGLNVTFTGSNILIFQTQSGAISASLAAILNVSSSSGLVSYPILVNATVPIAGLPESYGGNLGTGFVSYTANKSTQVTTNYSMHSNWNPYVQQATTQMSNTAIAGSRSPYLFAFGPAFIDPAAAANCSDQYISNSVNRTNYILITTNANNINSALCGFAGLVTSIANITPYTKPYLAYGNSIAPNFNLNNFVGGTQYLIDGNTLSEYDLSAVQSAIDAGSYSQSGFSPSYLSLLQDSQYSISPYGVAPLGVATRPVLSLGGLGNITSNSIPVNTVSNMKNTVSFWMQLSPSAANMIPISLGPYYFYVTNNAMGISTSGGNLLGSQTYGFAPYSTTPWMHVVMILPNGVPSSSSAAIYINGVRQNLQLLSGSFSSQTASNTISIGGIVTVPYKKFSGQIADVQVYSIGLTPYQAYQLYLEGVDGAPVNYTSLAGWWPLNGNANDYSQFHNNATAIGPVGYERLVGYAGDTLDGGSFYSPLILGVEGISQCYGRSACAWNGAGKIYVPVPQSYATSNVVIATSALGLKNNTIPDSLYLNPAENSIFIANSISTNVITTTGYDTVSFWMDLVTDGNNYAPVYFSNFGLSGNNLCFGYSALNSGAISIKGISAAGIANRWVNVVAILLNSADPSGGSNSALYINGTKQSILGSCSGSLNAGSIAPGSTVYIGGSPTYSPFSGSIADVQVYNTPLSANQVSSLYLNNSVPGIKPAGWWPLSSGYNGFVNQTGATTGNYAYEYGNGQLCSEANSLGIAGSACVVSYLPFGPR